MSNLSQLYEVLIPNSLRPQKGTAGFIAFEFEKHRVIVLGAGSDIDRWNWFVRYKGFEHDARLRGFPALKAAGAYSLRRGIYRWYSDSVRFDTPDGAKAGVIDSIRQRADLAEEFVQVDPVQQVHFRQAQHA